MKLKEIRNSLSTRLSLWIVFFAAAIFVAALGYVTVVARRAVRPSRAPSACWKIRLFALTASWKT